MVKRLKKEAVPSVFPCTNTLASPSSLQRATRKTKREENKSGFDTDSKTCSEENNRTEWNEELDPFNVGSEIYYTAEKSEDSESNLEYNKIQLLTQFHKHGQHCVLKSLQMILLV